jgi:DNA repair protein RecN (Recombination protein N)
MLTELKVSQFAIIDQIHIQFGEGLNILSGETGAGKSVLLKSLSLLMGEKAAASDIKTGAETALIEGSFDLSRRPDIRQNLQEMGVEVDEDVLVVRRSVSTNGKSKIYLNGSLSALNSLRDLIAPLITVTGQGAPLIEMTGQHDNRHLQSKSHHLDILDRFAGLWNERMHFTERIVELSRLRSELASLQKDLSAREQRLDFLRFQKDELEALNIQPGEDEELITQLKRIRNVAKLRAYYDEAEEVLYAGENAVVDQLNILLSKLQDLSVYDPQLPTRLGSLSQAKALLEDVTFELRSCQKELDTDPSGLEGLEERYSHFRKLQKKYGETAEHLINALGEIRTEMTKLERSDERIAALQQQEAQMALEVRSLAQKLHKGRKSAAREFQNLVNEELRDLNMKGVELEVSIHELSDVNSSGLTDVEFMIRASKKDEARSLAKYASGGELSRILLSIKQIIGTSDLPRTYLFDEVDTGVSGVTAEKVGRKLKAIASGQQVICVTHLAQVAAFADVHYLIEKINSRKGTAMQLRQLTQPQRVDEIARLISGESITRTSLDHAKELLKAGISS